MSHRTAVGRKIGPVFAALALPYLALVWRYWFVCDDAFITFRYSRNWALGHGPRYNLGEHVPVEGYSNFLWMSIAAIVEGVGADVRFWMPLLSVLCGLALLALVLRVLAVHVRADAGVLALAGAGFALFPPLAVWSTSGLATMPQALLMFAAWMWLAVEGDDRRTWAAAGAAGLLLALVRAEGLAWAVVIAGCAALQRRLAHRPILPALSVYGLILGVGYGIYCGWRLDYYESLVPNTARAKVHITAESLLRGLKYVGLYLACVLSPLALMATIPLGLAGRRRPLALGAGALAVGVPAYAVVVSGDYMTWFRLLVPGAPFMAISAGLALQEAWERWPRVRLATAVLATVLAGLPLIAAYDVYLAPESARAVLGVRKAKTFRNENEQWDAMVAHASEWKDTGEALKAYANPADDCVAAAIGNVGYYSDLFIHDRNGLVTREVALRPFEGELRGAGHDKLVEPFFFLELEPAILDTKVIEGIGIASRMLTSLEKMEYERVEDAYFPDFIELPSDDTAESSERRFLLLLKRGSGPNQVARRLRQFKKRLSQLP